MATSESPTGITRSLTRPASSTPPHVRQPASALVDPRVDRPEQQHGGRDDQQGERGRAGAALPAGHG